MKKFLLLATLIVSVLVVAFTFSDPMKFRPKAQWLNFVSPKSWAVCPNCGDNMHWKWKFGEGAIFYEGYGYGNYGGISVCADCILHPDKITAKKIQKGLTAMHWPHEEVKKAVSAVEAWKHGDKRIKIDLPGYDESELIEVHLGETVIFPSKK